MSPAPDMTDETIILNSTSNTAVLNVISSSDELDHNQFNEQHMDLGLVFFFCLLYDSLLLI
jgi:hypothetical protein